MPSFDAGTARYRIELDTSNMNNQFTQVTSGFNKADMAMNQMGKSAGALKNNFQSMNTVFAQSKTPLNSFSSTAGALPAQFDKVGQAAENTGKKVKGIGEFFRSNKGLIFGGAGLASAAAEAAGMMNMYGDAVAANAEAQKNLAAVQADTSASTQDVARAEQEASKAAKWLGMTTRNLVLSQMDQVFFATMVISQLSQMNIRGGILGKTLGTLKSAFSGVAGAQGASGMANALTAGSDAMGMFSTKATTTSKAMALIKNNIGMMIGAFAGLAASIVIINQVEAAVSELYSTIGAKPTTANLADQIFNPAKFKASMDEARTIMALTGASLLEVQTNAAGVGQRFLEMGGQIDKTGKVVVLTEDHFFSLGTAMDLAGKSSAQYIRWTAVKISQNEAEAKTLKWLTDSGITAADAQKIYNIAKKDAVSIDKEGITAQEAYAAATRYRTGIDKEANALLDEYLQISNQANVTTDAGVQSLEDYLHVKLDDANATDAEKAKTEDLIQTVLKLVDVREDETKALGDNMKKSQEYLDKKTQLEGEHLQKHLDYLAKKEADETKAQGDNLKNSKDYLAKKEADETKAQGDNLQNSLDYLRKKEEDETQAQGDNLKNSLEYLKKKEELETKAQGDSLKKHLDYLEKVKKANLQVQKDILSNIDTAQQSVAGALDIKIKDKDKWIKKIFDYIPNNITKLVKADIKMDLNIKAAREGIIDSLWAAIGENELRGKEGDKKMDKFVNGIIKMLGDKFPKSPAVDKMRQQLAEAVASDDTSKAVALLMEKWEAAPIPVQISPESLQELSIVIQKALLGQTYSVPVQGQYAGLAKTGWNSIINPNSGERKGLVPGSATEKYAMSKGYKGELITQQIQGAVPVEGVITQMSIPNGLGEGINKGLGPVLPLSPDILFGNGTNSSGGGGGNKLGGTDFENKRISDVTEKLSGFQKFVKTIDLVVRAFSAIEVAAQKAQTGIANLAIQGVNSMAILAKGSSKQIQGFVKNLNVGYVSSGHLQTGIANLANEGSSSLAMLAKVSSKQMNGMTNNLNKGYESAGHLQTGLANLSNEGSNSLMALAKASSKSMNGLVNNMKAGEKAVKSLKSAIDSLKDKTVTVRYKQVGAPQSQGGVYSFAEGGTVSAAGGLTTVSQPTHFIYGDNPGNHETLAFIPHNNPGPIMDRLEKMFSNRGDGSGEYVQNITLNISGSEIVNDKRLVRKIRSTLGDRMDRFGS